MGKRTFLLTLALLPCLFFTTIKASGGRPIDIEREDHVKPRSIEPECYYQDGYVYIIGDGSVTSFSATVTRLSDNAQWSNSGTGNILQIAVSTDAGAYRLELTLSDGNSYYGDYIL